MPTKNAKQVKQVEKELAVISTGGQQHVVRAGQTIRVNQNLISKKSLSFEDQLGRKKVTATVIATGRGIKVPVRKFKSKVRYLRRKGHRQPFSLIRIDKIS